MKAKNTPKPSKLLKKIRKQTGMSQARFASIHNLKQYNLSKYELGLTVPPGDLLLKILDFWGYLNHNK